MPILLLPKSIATSELVAHTIISKYSDHLPSKKNFLIPSNSMYDVKNSQIRKGLQNANIIWKKRIR